MKKCTNQIENICLIFWYEYERFDPFENFFQEAKDHWKFKGKYLEFLKILILLFSTRWVLDISILALGLELHTWDVIWILIFNIFI